MLIDGYRQAKKQNGYPYQLKNSKLPLTPSTLPLDNQSPADNGMQVINRVLALAIIIIQDQDQPPPMAKVDPTPGVIQCPIPNPIAEQEASIPVLDIQLAGKNFPQRIPWEGVIRAPQR